MMSARDSSDLRFVEIGATPLIKRSFPRQTTFFSTFAVDQRNDPDNGSYSVGWSTLGLLWRQLRDPGLSLVICQPTFFSPWNLHWLSRALFSRRIFRGHIPLVRAFGAQALRWRIKAPIAVTDFEDLPLINRNNFFLLDRCKVYFKRELPVDRWRLFLKTGHANLPTGRFRRQQHYIERLEKVRPISLGLPSHILGMVPIATAGKSIDIFFAGEVEGSSSVRSRGLAELKAMGERGVVVDIPDRKLPLAEFHRRCACAWLVWSPEGYGWDCFRHYEALACGSVPLINHPTIERYHPLCDGEHALYYDAEPGGLTRAVTAALADKPRLARIAEEGRRHVLLHHTPHAIASYVVSAALGLGPLDRTSAI